MTDTDTYLEAVLREQTFGPGSAEMKELEQCRRDVVSAIRSEFGNAPHIIEAGSKRKGTMIKEHYDLDLATYFPHDSTAAGETLEEIYDNIEAALSKDHYTVRKGSAIRVWNETGTDDLHIDVVPGRYVDGDDGDVFLHRTSGEKERLKTNLEVQIEHVQESGVVDAIRLIKLWRERRSLDAKTFVLELLVIKLLDGKQDEALSTQLTHVLEQFRDNSDSLSVEDPANPKGNDLSDMADGLKSDLSYEASRTLDDVANSGWETVFGEVDVDEAERVANLTAVSAATTARRPWRNG